MERLFTLLDGEISEYMKSPGRARGNLCKGDSILTLALCLPAILFPFLIYAGVWGA